MATSSSKRTHHPLSFSNWSAFAVCPNYKSSGKTSSEAERGNDSHSKLNNLCRKFNNEEKFTDEDCSDPNALWAFNFAKGKTLDKLTYEGQTSVLSDMMSEQYLILEGDVPMTGVYGWCDMFRYGTDKENGRIRLMVFDYKSGSPTNFDDMPQVKGYAMAAFRMLKSAGLDVREDEIDCYVMYGAAHTATYGMFTYDQLVENAANIAKQIDDSHPKPCKLHGHCKYCENVKECIVVNNRMKEIQNMNGTLVGMTDAETYDTLSVIKSICEKQLESLKEVARLNNNCLDDGNIRYELRQDGRGRSLGVDLNEVLNDLFTQHETMCDSQELIGQCNISKSAFVKLECLNKINKKNLEEIYDSHCKFGKPSERMVRVDVLR